MHRIKIKNFDEIDFVTADPNSDQFELPDGSVWNISDEMCHSCWSAGAVMKNQNSQQLYCTLCSNELQYFEFAADFLEEEDNLVSFLLPKDWSDEMRTSWFAEYSEARKSQEKIREDILKFGKGE